MCQEAGGVDSFLIGSELRGLTRVRDNKGKFPFVDALIALASKCKRILGTQTTITYGADWSEYFGYQPQDGSGDVLFNLDPLWASPNIDAIGIDNYMPLADWRDEGDPENELAFSNHSVEYLKSNIAREEGFNWYYASGKDRLNGVRTPITDGLGEPWLFRYKDIYSWWSNQHHNRNNGVRQKTPTAWKPQSKPVLFTEVGCPAIDKGANQPNVFYDPKSAQSAVPYFSSGGRDDLIQRRYLEAHFEFWNDEENNPKSELYNGKMVDVGEITPWAWDARPFPWFPMQEDTWNDGANWYRGHWLTGRLGGCSLQDLVAKILDDYGYDNIKVKLDGAIDGYLIPASGSARSALEPLLRLHNVQVTEQNGLIIIQDCHYADRVELSEELLVQEDGQLEKTVVRGNELELPAEAIISHGSIFEDYEEVAAKSRRLEGGSNRQISLQAPIVLPDSTASKLAESKLRDDWVSRETCTVTLPIKMLTILPGDIIEFAENKGQQWQVSNVERNLAQTVSLTSTINFPKLSTSNNLKTYANIVPNFFGKPSAILLDLPLLKSKDQNAIFSHMALSAVPWAGKYNVYSSYDANGFQRRATLNTQATIGTLQAMVSEGPVGRWDKKNSIIIALPYGSFESVPQLGVLNGANILALESNNGSYELIQFAQAEIQSDGKWRLSKLLRAQLGTELEMLAGSAVGARAILLNEAVFPMELKDSDVGLEQFWRVGPASDNNSASTYASIAHTNNLRSKRMLSPVHLRAYKSSSDDYHIAWIRRGTLNADNWEGSDIPFDTQDEKYNIRIMDLGNSIRRELTTTSQNFLYTKLMLIADFGSNHADFCVVVSQLNNSGDPGSPRKLKILKPN